MPCAMNPRAGLPQDDDAADTARGCASFTMVSPVQPAAGLPSDAAGSSSQCTIPLHPGVRISGNDLGPSIKVRVYCPAIAAFVRSFRNAPRTFFFLRFLATVCVCSTSSANEDHALPCVTCHSPVRGPRSARRRSAVASARTTAAAAPSSTSEAARRSAGSSAQLRPAKSAGTASRVPTASRRPAHLARPSRRRRRRRPRAASSTTIATAAAGAPRTSVSASVGGPGSTASGCALAWPTVAAPAASASTWLALSSQRVDVR